jgi:hypothetical protein
MTQAEDCLKRERERVSHYLHASTEQKLVEVRLNLTFFVRFSFPSFIGWRMTISQFPPLFLLVPFIRAMAADHYNFDLNLLLYNTFIVFSLFIKIESAT